MKKMRPWRGGAGERPKAPAPAKSGKVKSAEGVTLEINCWVGDEGHVWISWMDDLPAVVRDRLNASSTLYVPRVSSLNFCRSSSASIRAFRAFAR
jgi:hypothetical protein